MVRIKFLASPINPADINQIQGTYPVKPTFHTHLNGLAVGGNEGLAEIVELGEDVRGYKKGEWVIPIAKGLGTWRLLADCKPADLVKVDNEGVSDVSVATLAVNPCTAYRMLKDFVKLSPGDVVIQNGANSAVGQAVIQLSKAWGFKTVNIIRDRPDLTTLENELKSLGADVVVTEDKLRKPDTEKAIRELCGTTKAPKLGLNCVGGKSATNLARHLGPGASLVTYGGMSKEPVTLPTGLLIFQDLKFEGFWMTRWYATCTDAERQRMMDELLGLIREGRFREPFHERVEWGKVAEGGDLEGAGGLVRGAVERVLKGKAKKQILISS
ncbi:hypothetical protein HDV05_001054 [Chytridiales sp. JEL 0842]|nr:hypothetical protein HDV05_001054 [Chytridiales sp. JEL 0842]